MIKKTEITMTTDLKIGNAMELIHIIPDKSIDCVITSPPYWNLRDYNTPSVIFNSNKECVHEWINHIQKPRGGKPTDTTIVGANKNVKANNKLHDTISNFCMKCGAWKGQLGLEPTPELFIKHLLDFFDDIKIKLKNEGNCFVNLGDTYGSESGGYLLTNNLGTNQNHAYISRKSNMPKCLLMIPQRFAWGMIEHGWILRNEIIWHKSNHMPESVTDRLTKSHEIIWHFVKQQKYYYDLDAIREPHKTVENRPMGIIRTRKDGYNGKYKGNKLNEDFSSPRARTQRKNDNTGYGGDGKGIQTHSGNSLNHPKGKNPGDVWQINTQPYPEAHFAVFPIELVRKPILAGCPPGGTVLDPFGGSGTVAEFCRVNDRNAIIFELNPDYKPQIIKRAHLDETPLTKFFKLQ